MIAIDRYLRFILSASLGSFRVFSDAFISSVTFGTFRNVSDPVGSCRIWSCWHHSSWNLTELVFRCDSYSFKTKISRSILYSSFSYFQKSKRVLYISNHQYGEHIRYNLLSLRNVLYPVSIEYLVTCQNWQRRMKI